MGKEVKLGGKGGEADLRGDVGGVLHSCPAPSLLSVGVCVSVRVSVHTAPVLSLPDSSTCHLQTYQMPFHLPPLCLLSLASEK